MGTVHVEHGVRPLPGLLDVHLHELSSKHLSVVLVIIVFIILSLSLPARQRHVQSQRVVPEVHKPAPTETQQTGMTHKRLFSERRQHVSAHQETCPSP